MMTIPTHYLGLFLYVFGVVFYLVHDVFFIFFVFLSERIYIYFLYIHFV